MEHLYGDTTGLIHLISSFLALGFGGYVLLTPKGTGIHRWAGYAYTLAMLIVLGSSLMIFRLFGGFGPFHFITIFGLVYLFVGILPALIRWKSWLKWHVYFMYWSVVGLYAAFVAEVAVRLPSAPFWWAVGVGTLIVSVLGGRAYGKHKEEWNNLEGGK